FNFYIVPDYFVTPHPLLTMRWTMAQGCEPATNTQVFQALPSVIGVCDNRYLLWDFDRLSDYFNCFYRHDSSSKLFQYLIVKANSARRAISRLRVVTICDICSSLTAFSPESRTSSAAFTAPAKLSYAILARDARVGVVFRREASKQVLLLLWRTDTD